MIKRLLKFMSRNVDLEKIHLLNTQEEMCELAGSDGITAIIVTGQNNPKIFALALMSLLAKSSFHEGGLQHIIVSINGPDERTGSTEIQDIKQRFLEDLRKLKWHQTDQNGKVFVRDMPLTVTRTWSRVGHGQCVDGAVSWVHTKNYVLMHDDFFILDNEWSNQIDESLKNPDMGLVVVEPKYNLSKISAFRSDEEHGVGFPHLNTCFMAAKKSRLIGTKWTGFHSKCDLPLDILNNQEFVKFHNEMNKGIYKPLPETINFVSHEMSCYVLYYIQSNGLDIEVLHPKIGYHLSSSSWMDLSLGKTQNIRYVMDNVEKCLRLNNEHILDLYQDYFMDVKI